MICPVQFPLRRRRTAPGISLVELMVAVLISSILIVAMASVLGNTGGIYADTERTVETLRDGRAAMGIIRNDMAGKIDLGGASGAQGMFYDREESAAATRWGFFTSQSSKAQEAGRNPGDLCYVMYYTAVTADGNDRVSRKLYRKFFSSAETVALFKAGAIPPAVDPAVDDVVAFNVLDFRCEFRRRDEKGGWVAATTPEEIQDAAEMTVVLRLLTNEAALGMTSEGDWSPGGGGEGLGFDFDNEEDDDAAARSFRARFMLQR